MNKLLTSFFATQTLTFLLYVYEGIHAAYWAFGNISRKDVGTRLDRAAV